MPIITGTIDRDGAVIDVIIGETQDHRNTRKTGGHPVSPSITSRAAIDTGAGASGFSRQLLGRLGLKAIDTITIRTPVGPPQTTDRYQVSVSFVAGGTKHEFADALVIAADCFEPSEEIQGLIGRDILDHCMFEYWGPSRQFQFAF